jgi:hypothetical protein
MPFFLLHHQHEPRECAAAAWQSFQSPLRHRRVPSSCLAGGHGLWWQVGRCEPESDQRLAGASFCSPARASL